MTITPQTDVHRWWSSEAAFTVLLWALYFLGITFAEENHPRFDYREFVFAVNYFAAASVINYWLLPKMLYRKRYLAFLALATGVFALSIIVEEFVMEPIFYPNTRRSSDFQGVLPTIGEIGPTLLLFVGFKLAWDNLRKESKLEQAEKEKVESQLQFLRSQLNPHFLFNNLNNLYSYAQEGSPKTPQMILQLSDIMRYVLYESKGNFVPLEKELKYLDDFVRLQELQLEGRGKVTFSVQGNPKGREIAPLILIAFVENSFKHSLSSQAGDIVINIRTEITDNQLDFYCSNSYSPGENKANRYTGEGIGLNNVRKRLDLLYPGTYHLDIKAAAEVYQVNLRLEL